MSGALDIRALRRDYGDIDGEAGACRSSVALFDFSFMHRARVEGPDAMKLVQELTSRPLDFLAPGRIAYALRTDSEGHALADMTVWRVGETAFEVFSGRADEIAALRTAAEGARATVSDLSAETAIFAVQGPHCLRSLAALADVDPLRQLAYFAHVELEVAGVACRIGRLGYTGERGFEIVAPRAGGERLWALLARHARPAGFAAADILRIEAGFILFAHELRVRVTPAELGLAQFAPSRAAVGRNLRLACFKAGADTAPVLVGPRSDVAFPPEPGMIFVTSACQSACADSVLGLGFTTSPRSAPLADPARRFRSIVEVSLPFFDRGKRRPRGGWRPDLLPAP